jgi:hypothetical protein
VATVKELVAGEWRLDLNPKTRHGQTPLHLAAAHGHGTLVQVALLTMALLTVALLTVALLAMALLTVALLAMALLTVALLAMALLAMAPLTMSATYYGATYHERRYHESLLTTHGTLVQVVEVCVYGLRPMPYALDPRP